MDTIFKLALVPHCREQSKLFICPLANKMVVHCSLPSQKLGPVEKCAPAYKTSIFQFSRTFVHLTIKPVEVAPVVQLIQAQ